MGAIIAAEIVADYTKAQAEIQKAEKDINSHRTIGITLTTIIGFVLTYLGIKES